MRQVYSLELVLEGVAQWDVPQIMQKGSPLYQVPQHEPSRLLGSRLRGCSAFRKKPLRLDRTSREIGHKAVVVAQAVHEPTSNMVGTDNVAQPRVGSTTVYKMRVAELINPAEPLQRGCID